MEKRTGLTRKYRTEKLVEIEKELEENPLDSQFYGNGDPFAPAINLCEICNETPDVIEEKTSKGIRFNISCKCGRSLKEKQKKIWLAILAWNSINLKTAPSYTNFPFFNIGDLSPEEAKKELIKIRKHLELRYNAEGLRRSLRNEKEYSGKKTAPGIKYQQKLKAYLQWCLYAIKILNYQKK